LIGRRHGCIAALTVVLAVASPARGWAWGTVGHHYIAANYSKHLPAVIDGLTAWDDSVYAHASTADSRKSYTPGESYKHYIDIDYYPEFFAGTLTHDRATLEAEYGAATVLDNGVLPWAIGETVVTLTRLFQAQKWDSAALTIADLAHYVGDANQPLHCTVNYDGQDTGNNGIHSRYESTMLGTYVGQLSTPVMAVTTYASAVDEAFDIITASWAGVSTILAADNTAKAASGNRYNSTYYASLWNSTHALTQTRMDTATVVCASLVYTAWLNAGQPAVPGSSVGVPPLAADASVRLSAWPSPFRDVLTIRYGGAGPLNIDVFDVRGARVARLADGVSGQGSVTWRPAGSGLSPGLYFVRLRGHGVDVVRRVTLLE
jgi:hypothetical protein